MWPFSEARLNSSALVLILLGSIFPYIDVCSWFNVCSRFNVCLFNVCSGFNVCRRSESSNSTFRWFVKSPSVCGPLMQTAWILSFWWNWKQIPLLWVQYKHLLIRAHFSKKSTFADSDDAEKFQTKNIFLAGSLQKKIIWVLNLLRAKEYIHKSICITSQSHDICMVTIVVSWYVYHINRLESWYVHCTIV